MTSGLPPSLKSWQITQILRDRLAGKEYKQIALRVGCTPDQARHYWRSSSMYKPEGNRAAAAKRREAAKAPLLQERRRRAIAQREQALARATLQAEIAKAVREQPTATRYKPGPLEW
jgi:hypothetical protein